MNKIEKWFLLLINAALNGAAGSIAMLSVDYFTNTSFSWHRLEMIVIWSSLLGVANYVIKSPLGKVIDE